MQKPSINVYVGRLRPLIPELSRRLRAKGTTVSRELGKTLERLMRREGIEVEGEKRGSLARGLVERVQGTMKTDYSDGLLDR